MRLRGLNRESCGVIKSDSGFHFALVIFYKKTKEFSGVHRHSAAREVRLI